MKRVLPLLLAACGGAEGVALEATLAPSIAGQVQAFQVAFLPRPEQHDCRLILATGCLASQQKPLVELADGSRAARVAFTASGQEVRVEGVPVGRYMVVVEALGAGDKLLGNACDALVEVRQTSNPPIQIAVKPWGGVACAATLP